MTETSICSSSNSEYDQEEERIVLHVYDDESKEFTSLTTYHGMIRIYTSETWPSRIFWGVVVVTCVTLFMIQGGVLLEFYNSHPTATKIDEFRLPMSYLPYISICPYGFEENDDFFYFITQNEKNISTPSEFMDVSSREVLRMNSFPCEDVVESISIGSEKTVDFCSKSLTSITDIGICFTYTDWKHQSGNTLKVKLKQSFEKMYTAHIHTESYEVSRATTQVWLKPGTHAKISFGIEEQHYLPQNNWGTCKVQIGETYNHLGCLENCLSKAYKTSCGCAPFFSKNSKTHCTISEMHNCSNCYIGGVMGLFLGMSCITLLEVFIYLFKTIFGTLNNTRHKEFVERLLSDDDGSIHGSHEEIIITQKIEKPAPKVKFEEPNEQLIELPSPSPARERRLSLMPGMNGQLGVKVQFHRPNHTLKRNSVYLGNCDF
ncbi:hypothetical protein CAEBREN_32757 [Caenorhabditis brenneri]|uniref:Uncharacterized protein n=1 Tax=Caenorhabditis brenneri TaxID=135651 RepID=G0MB52_CAEBE|nr:hypothetical protein CAEBREN_32757 [Caenorhabditis brenneri]